MEPFFRILHIEDSPFDTKWLKAVLTKARLLDPFELISTKSMAKALQILNKERFDLIVTDLGLPDSEGGATVHALRSHYPFVPMVVLTARDEPTVAVESIRNGARDYFVKQRTDGEALARSLRYAFHTRD